MGWRGRTRKQNSLRFTVRHRNHRTKQQETILQIKPQINNKQKQKKNAKKNNKQKHKNTFTRYSHMPLSFNIIYHYTYLSYDSITVCTNWISEKPFLLVSLCSSHMIFLIHSFFNRKKKKKRKEWGKKIWAHEDGVYVLEMRRDREYERKGRSTKE